MVSTRPTASLPCDTRRLLKLLDKMGSLDATETAPLRVCMSTVVWFFKVYWNLPSFHPTLQSNHPSFSDYKPEIGLIDWYKNLRRTATMSANSSDSLLNLSILIHYLSNPFQSESFTHIPYILRLTEKVKTDIKRIIFF